MLKLKVNWKLQVLFLYYAYFHIYLTSKLFTEIIKFKIDEKNLLFLYERKVAAVLSREQKMDKIKS